MQVEVGADDPQRRLGHADEGGATHVGPLAHDVELTVGDLLHARSLAEQGLARRVEHALGSGLQRGPRLEDVLLLHGA